MMAFCAKHSLPVNDCWLLWSVHAAAAASHGLARLSLAAATTSSALAVMQQICDNFPEHSLRITGTYPHAEWQGSRIEGFVVAQGEPAEASVLSDFRKLAKQSAEPCRLLQMAPPPRTAAPAHDACIGERGGERRAVAAGVSHVATGASPFEVCLCQRLCC